MVEKKPSWEGAPKNCASVTLEKSGGGVQKINWLISDAPEIKWVSLFFPSEHTDATLKCHSMCVV